MSAVVTLENAALEVDPGSSRDAVVRVRNTGQIVDRFTIEILGDASPWASVSPAALPLFPGAEETVKITFSPPRGSSPRAGRIMFGVRVRSNEDPSDSVVEEGSVTVLPATAATAAIVPQTSRGSRGGHHEVTVTNGGNVPIEVAVEPADPDRLLSFVVRPPSLSLAPGATGSARLIVRPNETFNLGPAQSKPFGVSIVSSGQPPFELRGSLLQRAMLPSWLPKAAAAVLVLAVAGGVMAATVLRGTPASSPTPVPTSTAVAVASSQPPTASPAAPSAPPSVPPSEPSSAAPPPGPFQLTVTGDETTGGALNVICPREPADSTCLRRARDTVQALVTSLGGVFGGPGIVNPNDVAIAETLPIVMSRDVPFDWLAQEGAATDKTSLVVIDLAPLLAIEPGFAYAVVDSSSGPRRFVLPDGLARQLLDTLYELNPAMVDPGPTRSLPPTSVRWDQPLLDYRFEFASPTP